MNMRHSCIMQRKLQTYIVYHMTVCFQHLKTSGISLDFHNFWNNLKKVIYVLRAHGRCHGSPKLSNASDQLLLVSGFSSSSDMELQSCPHHFYWI